MIEILESKQPNVIVAKISDKVTKDDVDEVAAIAEKAIEKFGKVSCIGILENLKGYTITGFIEDFKFAMKHMKDFDKIALIGDKKFEEVLAHVSNLMVSGETKYFDISDKDKAEEWIYSKELSR